MLGVAIIGGFSDRGFDHKAAHGGGGCEVCCFAVIIVGANVADVRKRECHDLACIGGVGQHFLITGHCRVEADFGHRLTLGPKAITLDHCAISQNQHGGDFGLIPIAEMRAWFCFGRCGLFGRCHGFMSLREFALG